MILLPMKAVTRHMGSEQHRIVPSQPSTASEVPAISRPMDMAAAPKPAPPGASGCAEDEGPRPLGLGGSCGARTDGRRDRKMDAPRFLTAQLCQLARQLRLHLPVALWAGGGD